MLAACSNNTTSVGGDRAAMNNPTGRSAYKKQGGGAVDCWHYKCLLSEVKSRQKEGGSKPAKCILHTQWQLSFCFPWHSANVSLICVSALLHWVAVKMFSFEKGRGVIGVVGAGWGPCNHCSPPCESYSVTKESDSRARPCKPDTAKTTQEQSRCMHKIRLLVAIKVNKIK